MKTVRNNRTIKGDVLFTAMILFSMVLMACSKSDPPQNPEPIPIGGSAIKGTVKDEKGNPYPKTGVTFSKGSEKVEMITNVSGNFEGETKDLGTYSATLLPPLSTEIVTNLPVSVNVQANQTATVDFVIQPQSVKAHLNFGSVQILEEIVDMNGNTPTDPNEPLYAKNNFDEPLGLLTEIKAPDGHQVILSEFQTAQGNMIVHCNGNSSTIEIALEGMIPNGTYTFWLAFLKKTRKVGEQIDFANDFVNFNNPPIGASNGTENIAVADASGKIDVTLEHGSCILTDEVALVIPVLYHINGQTFGGGHVPDPEEMVHMLVYFQ
ncbi:carboxypeptidase-like regulatory domain-containing protein [Maribacter halichondriae]|uniref:carboxypeptidase-like regulatory domain-containing protein n=1 Tax=Maribacter halichondriae TaxID=2980554 RepID=UPI002359F4C8|nr:carboxypeptidase-like regulatory domain-containing protein [Maribacter sp. Hal144]